MQKFPTVHLCTYKKTTKECKQLSYYKDIANQLSLICMFEFVKINVVLVYVAFTVIADGDR